jgi:short-subunit dehydrogenase
MKKALIIGASSGIGRALAHRLAKEQYELGLMARREEKLKELQAELQVPSHTAFVDVKNAEEALVKVEALITQMGGVDLIILNSGTGFHNPNLDWNSDKETLETNVLGFCALAGFAFKYFSQRGQGHLVGISSIAALRGGDYAPAYNASKAFDSNYLEGLRKKAFKEGRDIVVTDIQPGFVDTDLIKGSQAFWVASADEAAEQICDAIRKRKTHAYITRRWRVIGWLMKLAPDWLYLRS